MRVNSAAPYHKRISIYRRCKEAVRNTVEHTRPSVHRPSFRPRCHLFVLHRPRFLCGDIQLGVMVLTIFPERSLKIWIPRRPRMSDANVFSLTVCVNASVIVILQAITYQSGRAKRVRPCGVASSDFPLRMAVFAWLCRNVEDCSIIMSLKALHMHF